MYNNIIDITEDNLNTITEEEMAHAWVEYEDEYELAYIKLLLAHAVQDTLDVPAGCVTAEVGLAYMDMMQHAPAPVCVLDDEDVESKLNQVIELQARMATGMSMIEECNRVINKAKQGKRLPYKVFMQWVNRRTMLWSHWRKLLAECKALATGNSVWPKYFQLVEGTEDEHYDPIAHKRSAPEVDTRMLTSDEAYAISHVELSE